jgi:MFS family permease
MAAPILSIINEDIGPDASYNWIGIVNTLTQAVGFTLVGRLSDLCGRRYFVIAGNTLGLVGSIVCCTAHSIPTVIGGNVLLGFATSVQTSVPFILGELIPMKHRFLTTGLMYFWVTPGSVFGPAISYGFVQTTTAGWRWVYYLLVITNTLATILWTIFYHPPTFSMLTMKSRSQMVKDFDWVGLVLFTGGLVVFLIGLSWGGGIYPWTDARVIGTISTGGVTVVAFVIWECFGPMTDTLVPMHLFSNNGL